MKALILVLISLALVVSGIAVACVSSLVQKVDIYYYNVSDVASPPPGWYDYYWSVLDYGTLRER